MAEHRIIIFSHGMGVRKDNRGLFTRLAADVEKLGFIPILFEYNDIDAEKAEVAVPPFSKQAEKLNAQIAAVRNNHPDAEITIIGQSQGGLIPAVARVTGIKQVIAISPFFHTSMDDILRRYEKEGNVVDFYGETRRKRSDGSTTIMPKEYWAERFTTNVEDLYNDLALHTRLVLINAMQDEIMDSTNLGKIRFARIINLDGDHDFSGEYQDVLARVVGEELQ